MRLPRWIGALALLLCLRGLTAQVIEVSAGTSTAYDSQGASLHLRKGFNDTQLGLGMVGGHFAAGGAVVHTTKTGSITVGQQELSANLPTDVFDTRHTLFGTGIGIKRTTGLGTLTTFTGSTSLESGTPLFRASSLGKISHFTQWTMPTSTGCRPTLTALTGATTVGIASVECTHSRSLTYAFSAGAGAGSPYVAGSLVFSTRKLSLKTSYVYASEKFQRGNNPYQPTPEPVREKHLRKLSPLAQRKYQRHAWQLLHARVERRHHRGPHRHAEKLVEHRRHSIRPQQFHHERHRPALAVHGRILTTADLWQWRYHGILRIAPLHHGTCGVAGDFPARQQRQRHTHDRPSPPLRPSL